ncbi:MAG: hypothetical protein GX138_08650 [Firmicutes bacterium]|jgi:hypothetical protein|nr:hypothetical protein [Bacillota bacterium]
MKTGIVGPKATVDIVLKILENKKLFVEYIPIVYQNLQELPTLLRAHLSAVDNLFFVGPIPYHYVVQKMNLPCPAEYASVDAYAISKTLFKAAVFDGHDVSKLSVDFFENDNPKQALLDLEYKAEDINIEMAHFDIFDENYPELNAQFHKENYAQGKANVILTGTVKTYEILKEDGYPAYLVYTSPSLPEDMINRLRLRNVMALQDDNLSAVISIQLKYKDDFDGDSITELQNFKIHATVMEKVYYYAQRLDASVEKGELGKIIYRIYTSKAVLSDDTEGFRQLLLMEELEGIFGVEKVCIGLGLGKTSAEARRNADFGRERAASNDVSCFFIVYEDQKIAGPIIQVEVPKRTDDFNSELFMISRDTQIGLDKLIVIDSVLNQYNVDVITPGELARLTELPLNQVNRLITKLESSGYAKVVGKKPLSGSGRPSRLLEFNLKKVRS